MNDIFEALGFRSRLPAPFPPLPVELVRHMMELAAEEDRHTALHLPLVSKAVHAWITPILYRTVILTTREQVAFFHVALRSADPKAALQVKNLFVRSMSNATLHSVVKILSACIHVERLVVDSLCRQPVDPSLSWPTPWEVVFVYGARSWLGKNHPVLQNVTHIHLDEILFDSTVDACIGLPKLTHLGVTHVADNNNNVSDDNFVRLTRHSLSASPSLEIVLIHSWPISAEPIRQFRGRIWTELANIEDDRLLARPGLGAEEYCELLETGMSIWDDARAKFSDWRASIPGV